MLANDNKVKLIILSIQDGEPLGKKAEPLPPAKMRFVWKKSSESIRASTKYDVLIIGTNGYIFEQKDIESRNFTVSIEGQTKNSYISNLNNKDILDPGKYEAYLITVPSYLRKQK